MNHSNGPNTLLSLTAAAPHLTPRDIPQQAHALQLYHSDESLIASVAAFIGAGLGAGDHALVLATKSHCDAIDVRLLTHGLSVAALKARNQLTFVHVADLMGRFVQNGCVDENAARSYFETLLSRLAPAGRNLHVFSELAPLLCAEGHDQAALTIEAIAADLVARYRFRLLCAYAVDAVGNSANFTTICKHHNCFIPAESYTGHHTSNERLQEVCLLQQQSAALKEEVRRRQAAESASKEEHATMQAALSIAELGTWEFHMTVGRLICSTRCKSILGLRHVDGSDVRALLHNVHPEHRAGTSLRLERAVADAIGYEDEFRVMHSSGQQRWVRMICRYSLQNGGTVFGFVRDITDDREVTSNDWQKRCSNNN